MLYRKLFVIFFALAFFLFPLFSSAQVNQSALIQQLQRQVEELTKKIQVLQQQLGTVQSELGAPPAELAKPIESTPETTSTESIPEFTHTLSRGSSGDDVRKLQEFLAKDKEIYPDSLITGYFGPKTEQALKRWQEKHNIEAVGILGPQTRARFQELGKGRIQELITEGAGVSGNIPSGLLTAPGIQKKFEVSTTTQVISSTTPISQEDFCPKDPAKCYTEKSCKAANYFWYTVSCHKTPPPSNSCAESYNFCINSDECSKNGFYWCRNSCYATSTACLGQTFVAPVTPTVPAIPATPAQPTSQTNTTTVPAIPATPATPAVPTIITTSTTTGDTTVPSTPTGLVVSNTSPDIFVYIKVSWTASTDNVGVMGYKVYRNGAQIGSVTGTVYDNPAGLVAGTTYSYTVVAYDAAGNVSAQSSAVSVTTLTSTTTSGSVPTAPSNAIFTPGARITVQWTDNADNETRFEVYIRSGEFGAWQLIGQPPSAPGVGSTWVYSDASPASGAPYYYYVKACNNFGCSLPSNTVGPATPGVSSSNTSYSWRLAQISESLNSILNSLKSLR